jgi:hypothetical protein
MGRAYDFERSNPGKAAKYPVPLDRQIIGNVDIPSQSETITLPTPSRLMVSGWAASTTAAPASKVQKVIVLLQDKEIESQIHFFSRPDVAEAFDRPIFAISGWEMDIAFQDLRAGPYTLSVRAVPSNGEAVTLGVIRIRIVE